MSLKQRILEAESKNVMLHPDGKSRHLLGDYYHIMMDPLIPEDHIIWRLAALALGIPEEPKVVTLTKRTEDSAECDIDQLT